MEKELNWRKAEFKVERESQVGLKINDSIQLFADVYHPKNTKSAPTILIRVPLDNDIKGKIKSKVFGNLWAQRGYNVVIQGVRGKFGSSGKHIPFVAEREDGIKTLEWLNQQEWHNGLTGMWGGSYFGYTQWVLYDQKQLGLTTLFTHISSTSNYDMFHPNGSFSLETALFWATRSHPKKDTQYAYEDLRTAYEELNVLEIDNRATENIPFYNDWVAHTNRDSFWLNIDDTDVISKLEVPTMMMAGWFDPYLVSQVADFNALKMNPYEIVKKESKLIIGPWGHARTIPMPNGYMDKLYRASSLEYSLEWYDKFLSGKEITETPPVKIFVMGINEWRYENEFPLARTIYTKHYLNSTTEKAEGILSDTLVSTNKSTFDYNPLNPVPSRGGAVLGPRSGIELQNEIEKREDVLVFSTPILTEQMEITGNIELVLFVSTDAVNTDFTAKLVDVYPNGDAYNISEGILRRDYLANEITKITIALNPTSIVFLKNHQIRVEISSSNYPRYSRNLNTGVSTSSTAFVSLESTETKIAHQTILTGMDYPSYLILPLIPHK